MSDPKKPAHPVQPAIQVTQTPPPEPMPKNIPRPEDKPGTPVAGNNLPDLEDYDEGVYLRKSDNEEYALAIVEDDPLKRTHKCMNTVHSWEGTEDQFIEAFTEKDGKPIKKDEKPVKPAKLKKK